MTEFCRLGTLGQPKAAAYRATFYSDQRMLFFAARGGQLSTSENLEPVRAVLVSDVQSIRSSHGLGTIGGVVRSQPRHKLYFTAAPINSVTERGTVSIVPHTLRGTVDGGLPFPSARTTTTIY